MNKQNAFGFLEWKSKNFFIEFNPAKNSNTQKISIGDERHRINKLETFHLNETRAEKWTRLNMPKEWIIHELLIKSEDHIRATINSFFDLLNAKVKAKDLDMSK